MDALRKCKFRFIEPAVPADNACSGGRLSLRTFAARYRYGFKFRFIDQFQISVILSVGEAGVEESPEVLQDSGDLSTRCARSR